jgi:hypothetical protein
MCDLSLATADWQDLSSADFKDSATGEALASGYKFAWIGVVNLSLDGVAYVKYRARVAADDTTDNELPILPYSLHSDDIGTLTAEVTTISVKKPADLDSLYVIAGFDF